MTRDQNGLGENCVYDSLNRKTTCADLQEQLEGTNRSWTYNAHNAVLTSTNAEGHSTSNVYDVRDRLTAATDRNSLTTSYTYDDNNNLLTLTDPRNNTRSWIYDLRNLKTRKQYPTAGDKCNYRHDALGRLLVKGQQNGSTIHYTYDLAGRLTERVYGDWNTWPANSPDEPPAVPPNIESTDTLTYDAASRVITTYKGRYDVTTDHTYADDGLVTD